MTETAVGTPSLAGTNTYTGTTTIAAGTLVDNDQRDGFARQTISQVSFLRNSAAAVQCTFDLLKQTH